MKNATRQIVRHLNHKHSRLLQHLFVEDKLKSEEGGALAATAASVTTSNVSTNFSHSPETSSTANNCFSTNQVLVIIAVTCFLNFAFIILIMMCVQILGSTATEREISEEDALLNEERDDLLAETDVGWESAKFRVASFPDNIITRKIAERLLKAKQLKANSRYWDEGFRRHSTSPISRTYHFAQSRFYNDDPESDVDFQKYDRDSRYTWDDYGTRYTTTGIDPRREH